MRGRAACAAAGVGLLIAGCGSGGPSRAPTAPATRPTAGAGHAGLVPRALAEVEPRAERVIELAIAGDGAGAARVARRLVVAVRAAAGTARAAGVSPSMVSELRARATAVDDARATGAINLALSANGVAQLVARVVAPFAGAEPQLIALSAADREVALRARPELAPALIPAVNALTALWVRYRVHPATVFAHSGITAAYERHVRRVERLARAQDLPGLRREADVGDALLDAAEPGRVAGAAA